MSTTARSTQKGGKNNKVEASAAQKSQKIDVNKTESPKAAGSEKSQPTAEQMRMAEIMDTRKDDLALKDKIKQVMDATQKTEDEVCTALHDCDNDANRAVNYLLEGSLKNEWSLTQKKKKNRTASTNKADGNNHVGGSGEEDWDQPQVEVTNTSGGSRARERTRQRGSGPPRMRGRGSMESRGWRGRENKENERNLEDGDRDNRERGRRGGRMANGPGRGGRGGRGGGRLGTRTFQSRDKPGGNQGFPNSIDTWNNPSADDGSGERMENWDTGVQEENWDTEDTTTTFKPKPNNENWGDGFPSPEDWDNEEYTGSLADSKVFTASSGPEPTTSGAPPTPGPGPDQPPLVPEPSPQQQLESALQSSSRPPQMPPSGVGANTLTPAQSQYLTQLTQSSESYKALNSTNYSQPPVPTPSQPVTYPANYAPPPTSASVAYSANYAVTGNSYSSSLQDSSAPTQNLPPRAKTQKPRVPPPSKIPSSAVEMPPGDAIAVSLLDVQFGGLEFGSDAGSLDASTTLETSTTNTTTSATPTPPAPTPTSVTASVASIMESYATNNTQQQQQQQQNMANALAQAQKLTNNESLLNSEVVVTQSNNYSATPRQAPSVNNVMSEFTNSSGKSTVDTTHSLAYNSADSTQLYLSQAQSDSYQKPTSYPTPTPVSVSSYNASIHSTPQVTSSNTGYSSQSSGYTNNSYGSANVVTQSSSVNVNSYPSSNSSQYNSNQTSYAYTSYPTAAGNSYHNSSAQYQGSNSGYPYQNTYQQSSTASVNNVATQNHKMNSSLASQQAKESQYDSSQVTNNSIPAVSTVSATPSLGLSATSQTAANTKVTALTSGNKSGIVAGMPPQVPPMINTQYIMSQAGGYPFLQQPMFSYDDLMLQQRLAAAPAMSGGYYDMNFQQPTSLGTGRDGSLPNVAAYSISDGRFARADNNASPVPSTLSQQSQGHQQPMLNPTGLPPGYTYIYSGFPNFTQYGTPTPLYPMAPTAAAGNSTSTQYKTPSYGSAGGYSTGGFETADAYKVGGYSTAPAQTKAGNTPTPTTNSADLYGKGHATLNKVNSYDKAGFHSGTPPPLNLSGAVSQSGLAPSATYPQHLFFSPLPPHQQHAHSATLMHQPLHQIDMRTHGRRMDGTSNSGPRSQASTQPNKAGTNKQNFSPSFWANAS